MNTKVLFLADPYYFSLKNYNSIHGDLIGRNPVLVSICGAPPNDAPE
jgi:hypothetical protein